MFFGVSVVQGEGGNRIVEGFQAGLFCIILDLPVLEAIAMRTLVSVLCVLVIIRIRTVVRRRFVILCACGSLGAHTHTNHSKNDDGRGFNFASNRQKRELLRSRKRQDEAQENSP